MDSQKVKLGILWALKVKSITSSSFINGKFPELLSKPRSFLLPPCTYDLTFFLKKIYKVSLAPSLRPFILFPVTIL